MGTRAYEPTFLVLCFIGKQGKSGLQIESQKCQSDTTALIS